jgi:hypothetical protein
MTADVVPIRPDQPPAPERFCISDDRMAHWAMKKLAVARQQLAEYQGVRDAEVARYDEWLASISRADRDTADRMEALLLEYAADRRDRTGEATLSTPYGRVRSKAPAKAGKCVVVDLDAFVEWANGAHPELVEIRFSAKVAEAKKVLRQQDGAYYDPESGEQAPGIAHDPGEVSFTVDPDTRDPRPMAPLPEGAA